MAQGTAQDPFISYRFRVELEGIIEAGFAECAGLQAEIEVEEVREGGANDFVYRLAKGSKHTNLMLKRGVTSSDALWKWYREVADGVIKPKNVDVILLDVTGEEKWRWSFREAYPVKWVGPELKAAGSSAVAIETLELVHHGFEASTK